MKESEWMVYIEKDLPRTYQLHELFEERGGLGQTEMKKVLKAYSVYNPKVGYCQVHIVLNCKSYLILNRS